MVWNLVTYIDSEKQQDAICTQYLLTILFVAQQENEINGMLLHFEPLKSLGHGHQM